MKSSLSVSIKADLITRAKIDACGNAKAIAGSVKDFKPNNNQSINDYLKNVNSVRSPWHNLNVDCGELLLAVLAYFHRPNHIAFSARHRTLTAATYDLAIQEYLSNWFLFGSIIDWDIAGGNIENLDYLFYSKIENVFSNETKNNDYNSANAFFSNYFWEYNRTSTPYNGINFVWGEPDTRPSAVVDGTYNILNYIFAYKGFGTDSDPGPERVNSGQHKQRTQLKRQRSTINILHWNCRGLHGKENVVLSLLERTFTKSENMEGKSAEPSDVLGLDRNSELSSSRVAA